MQVMRSGDSRDGQGNGFSSNDGARRLWKIVQNGISNRFSANNSSECVRFLRKMFDDIGFRHALIGYEVMLKAAQLYAVVPDESAYTDIYLDVAQAAAESSSAQWADNQLRYLIKWAKNSGAFSAFAGYVREYLGKELTEKELLVMTPEEFLCYVRSIIFSQGFALNP